MAKAKAQSTRPGSSNGATLGFEKDLWAAADALRGSMDAAEYKHVALGLIFLKYISDAFEAYRAQLERERDRAPTPKTPTSTAQRTSFGCRPRRAGDASRPRRGNRSSAR